MNGDAVDDPRPSSMSVVVRKTILVVHLLVNAAWLGSLLAMLLLIATGQAHHDLAAFAVNDVAVWTSLLVLATSMAFALFTPWGFFRFRWITLKWIALATLALGGVFLRTPAINALAAFADVHGAAGPRGPAVVWLALEVGLLSLVIALSVAKPWGRTRHQLEPGRKVRIAVAALVVLVAAFAAAQSALLAGLRGTPIAAVDLSRVPPGRLAGCATVGVEACVAVNVDEGRISRIDIITLPSGHYATLARGVADKIVRTQRVDVDGVTGATTTSRALQKATERALLDAKP
jgi:uncharacterized protein with FMN-binding domain